MWHLSLVTRVIKSRTDLNKAKNGGADIMVSSLEVDIIKIEAIGGQRL